MLSMVEYVHQRILNYEGYRAVDFTMGNGKDTLFLAGHYEEVWAFDIQEEALMNTLQKVKGYKNVTCILDNHINMDLYLDSFDVGLFNLGYLPHSQSALTTVLENTKIAIQKAISLMNKALFIVVYPGHEEGQREADWIDCYVKELDSHLYNVSCFKMLNKNQAPYVIEIEKR